MLAALVVSFGSAPGRSAANPCGAGALRRDAIHSETAISAFIWSLVGRCAASFL
jgi:hypothetical protein